MTNFRTQLCAALSLAATRSVALAQAPSSTAFPVTVDNYNRAQSDSRNENHPAPNPAAFLANAEWRSSKPEQVLSCTAHLEVHTIDRSQSERPGQELASIDFSPAEIVRYQTGRWRGLQLKTVQIISCEQFEYNFKGQCHLFIAVEQGVRYDGETFVEGLQSSTIRNYSQKLVFVPAGRRHFGVQNPRLLTRSICLYIDPQAVLADPDLRFAEANLQPGLLFDDSALWETVRELKAQIGSADPGDRMYADALGGLLAHELLRRQGTNPKSIPINRGGRAPWQQKRVIDFMEEHLAEDIPLTELAALVRLSPYDFLRSFKRSLGQAPYRYWLSGESNAQRACWQIRAHQLPRSRSLSDTAQRVRSALPFIGSPGRGRRIIVAALSEPPHSALKP